MLDHFQMGPNLVRGFRQSGIRPARPDARLHAQDALGGTMYWGASLELQIPLYFMPKDVGIKACDLCRCRLALGLQGADLQSGDRRNDDFRRTARSIRSSVGAGLVWDSPFGPLRFDYAIPITKEGLRQGAGIPLRRRHHDSDHAPRIATSLVTAAWWHDRAAFFQADQQG